ncbi:MAG: hypothetical protein U1F61_25620 [Opitutaceae bacterium]
MSAWIDPAYHLAGIGAGIWLILLWLHARLRSTPASVAIKVTTGVMTAGLLLLPFGGSRLGCWMQGFHPNPSVPGICLIGAALAQRLFGCVLLKVADLRALLVFGTVVGSVLYLHTLWPNATDLYYWGWLDQAAIWTMAGSAVIYLAVGNRMGVLILLSLIAYTFRVLESQNAWDYLIDPVTWMVCVVLQASWLLRATGRALVSLRRNWRRSTAQAESTFDNVAPPLVESATPGTVARPR